MTVDVVRALKKSSSSAYGLNNSGNGLLVAASAAPLPAPLQSSSSASSLLSLQTPASVVGRLDPLGGPCIGTSKPLIGLRDDIVKGEADAALSEKLREAQLIAAARRIQAAARRFLCRRRYVRHTILLKLDLEAVRGKRREFAAVLLQRHFRGFIHRRRFQKFRFAAEEDRRRDEAAGGKKGGAAKKASGGGKKGGVGPGAPVPPPPLPNPATLSMPGSDALRVCREAALARNGAIVVAVKPLLRGLALGSSSGHTSAECGTGGTKDDVNGKAASAAFDEGLAIAEALLLQNGAQTAAAASLPKGAAQPPPPPALQNSGLVIAPASPYDVLLLFRVIAVANRRKTALQSTQPSSGAADASAATGATSTAADAAAAAPPAKKKAGAK